MATKIDIKKALVSCFSANLKAHSITDTHISQTVDAYHSVLKDMEPDALEAATIHYISSATFFPTPGDLRQAALELQMIALGIPSAGEAWAQVQVARQYREASRCEIGIDLASGVDESEGYWASVQESGEHIDGCELCTPGGYFDNYDHPAVKATVELMGGLSRVMTGNPVSDRARFQDSYREVIAKEKTLFAMPQEVSGYIDQQKAKRISGEISLLSEGMKK